MADPIVRGRFVWHELSTTDVSGAIDYYKKTVGWTTQSWELNKDYLMWVAKSGPVGGVSALRAAGAPHWMPYVGIPDIDATVAQVQKLGGTVVVPITTLASGGRYAVLADPQGAHIGIYTPEPNAKSMPPAMMPQVGEFSWHELMVGDYKSAFAFYQALFGWEKTGEHDMGAMGIYFMFGLNGQAFGGMFNKPPGAPAAWCCYVQVGDAAKATKAAAKAGGKVCNGPVEVPGGSWIAQISDPQGVMYAVVSSPNIVPASVAAKSKQVARKKTARKKTSRSAGKKATKRKMVKKKVVKKKSSKRSAARAAPKRGAKKKTVTKRVKSAAEKKQTRRPAAKRKAARKK